jgi:hypothetical protein
MNEYSSDEQRVSEKVNIESVKRRIADISSLPLERHSQEFEDVHGDLQRALTQIDGL